MRYELLVGLRYTRAKRRNRFIGINSAVSMIGITVGVWALIVVLSVMNGFQKEVRTRILSVVSHVQISGPGGVLADWKPVAQAAAENPHVVASAPFVQGQAMLSAGRSVRGALIRGIEPGEEERVADFARHMRAGSLEALKPGEFGVVLGVDLARALGTIPGDKVALVAPQGTVTPAGVIPRLKQFTVVGLFEAGIVDADAGLALVNLRDAQTLYQMGGAVTGVRLKLDDLFEARAVARELTGRLPQDAYASDWTRSHANFFRAVEIEKRMMFLILALIILVAAINIISTLVVAVADKQADIAILRTLGAAPGSIMQVFVVQGMVIGVVGIFEAGISEADAALALIHLQDAQTLYQMGATVTGVRLKLDDLFAAREVAREVVVDMPPDVYAVDWTRSHANFFRAVEIEKRMMFIILTLIILVAAINIISTLVVAVADKQADIAILRTLGARPWSIMQIFIVQGMMIGVIGTLLGVVTGIVVAQNIDVIVPFIERALSIKFLSKDVYLIPELPSDLQMGDVITVSLIALGLSLAATLPASWRAARVNPAEALRYE